MANCNDCGKPYESHSKQEKIEHYKNQCPCGSLDLKTVYFTQELDPIEKRVQFTFNAEFREGWTKSWQCAKCNNVHIDTNIFK